MTRCAEGAAQEPLAGTAPRARWWWLIELPGSWGRDAVKDCRVPAVRALTSDEQRRVLLVRPPGRHPATDPRSPLRVWIAGALPGDPPVRLAVAEDPGAIREWPIEGPPDAVADPQAPILAVCTNSSRDLCCGLDGRALVQSLADAPGVWECSHLGGHRFAPTALHVPTGLVYGRLTEAVARHLLSGEPDTSSAVWLRGRSALDAPAQTAEVDLLRRGISPDPRDPQIALEAGDTVVEFAGAPSVRLRSVTGVNRAASCGGVPEVAVSWEVVEPG